MDGIKSFTNSLANTRNALRSNKIEHCEPISSEELNNIYKIGIANKIVRLKSTSVFKEGFYSEDEKTSDFVNKRMMREVRNATKWMLVFGRGIVVIDDGANFNEPLGNNINLNKVKFKSFSGYNLTTTVINTTDPQGDRYYKPNIYHIKGLSIHHSRVLDFTYVEPTLNDKPYYLYGGISEFELIYNQLINDQIVERSGASILEKNSTLFYKIKGFKERLRNKQEGEVLKYISNMENVRSIYGAGILDQEDETKIENQSLSNLADVDLISLRRLSLVTGLTLSWLVGESVKGLNSTGENESQIFWNTIKTLGQEYIEPVLNDGLTKKLGLSEIHLVDQYQQSPLEKSQQESVVLDNALKMQNLGIDYEEYLKSKGIIKETDLDESIESDFLPVDEDIKDDEDEAING